MGSRGVGTPELIIRFYKFDVSYVVVFSMNEQTFSDDNQWFIRNLRQALVVIHRGQSVSSARNDS